MRKGQKDIIEIKEDVRIPGTDVILEAGDQIKVLSEDELDQAWKVAKRLHRQGFSAEDAWDELSYGFDDSILSELSRDFDDLFRKKYDGPPMGRA